MMKQSVGIGALLHFAAADPIVRVRTHDAPPTGELNARLREALQSTDSSSLRTSQNFVRILAEKAAAGVYAQADPDLDTIDSIKSFVTDIETHAVEQHNTDTSDLQTAIDHIVACGLIPQQTADNHTATLADCEARTEEHDECRSEEESHHGEMDAACQEYHNFRKTDVKSLSNDCMPQRMDANHISIDRTAHPLSLQHMETCLVNTASWLFRLHELYLKCKGATEAHSAQVTVCTADQEELEQCVCDYRSHMISGCENHHDCHAQWSTAFGETETRVKAAESARKLDHIAGSKIKCYLDVLTADNGQRQAVLDGCETSSPDTSQFDITYPAIPEIDVCPLPPTPCMDEWRNGTYFGKEWSDTAEISACHECSSTADPSHATLQFEWKPPTPVPTPEPTVEPTPRPTPSPTNPPLYLQSGEYAFSGRGNKKWCWHDNKRIKCKASHVNGGEIYKLVSFSGRWLIRSNAKNWNYVKNHGSYLKADTDYAGSTQFYLVHTGDGSKYDRSGEYYMKAYNNGKWCKEEDKIRCNQNSYSNEGKFKFRFVKTSDLYSYERR